MDKGKLMVTSDIEYWNAEFPNRKFAAKLDFSAVKPEDYYQVNRGFGNEFFVKDPSKVRVEKVIPIEQAIKEHQQFQKVLEKNITSKSQLADFYNQAVKVAKEAGEVAPRVIDEALQPLAQEARKYKTAEEFLKVNPIKESKVSQLVYHGSPNQFETFDIKFMGKQGRTEGSGFYFTDRKDIAQGYAREEGGKLFEVYLDIKKPMSLEQRKITTKQLNDVLEEVLKKDREALGNYGGDINSIGKENTKKIARDILETNETDVDLISDMINSGILPPQEINDIFRKVSGYDGIITKWPANPGEKPVNLFIALSPDQIKTKSQLTDFYTQAVKGEIKPKVISAERMAGLKKIFTEVNEKVKLKEPQITIKPIKTIADEAIKFVKENPNSSLVAKKFRNPRTKELESGPLLFRRIGESIRNGELNLEELPKIVTKYGLSANETARLFEDAATYSGRTLQALSRVEKEIRALLPDIQLPERIPTLWERFKSGYLAVDNFRRGLLVTQLATAARNAISQTGRYSFGTITDGMNGVVSKMTRQKESFTPFFEDIAAVLRKFSKVNVEKLEKVLTKNPIESARLYNTPVGDVALTGKITNTLNAFNRGQEYFFRNLILDAKLNAASKREGIKIEDLGAGEVERAVDEALDWTFAKSPIRGSFGDSIMRMYRAMPPITLINPFPRFMSNAVKFLYDYSPAGIMSLFNSKTRATIAAGVYNAISKARSEEHTSELQPQSKHV